MPTETENTLARLCERQTSKLKALSAVKTAAEGVMQYFDGNTSMLLERVECLREALRLEQEVR